MKRTETLNSEGSGSARILELSVDLQSSGVDSESFPGEGGRTRCVIASFFDFGLCR